MRYEKNQERKRLKRKKKRRLRKTVLIFFFLILLAFGYIFIQYIQGIKKTMDEANIDQIEYEFNGKQDQYGGTNVLLIGSDSRGEKNARSDTIMIAQYHPENHSYKLISIMRDTYVDIPEHGKNKINTAFALGGPELLRKTIKENFDVDVQYYAIIDFEGFVHLIDEAFPDGVEIEVEKAMSAYIGVTLEPGVQRLDGEHLLGYVRFRHDAMGDFNRVERQQKALKEVASQFASFQTLTKLPKLVGVVKPFVNTNLNTSDIIYIGKDYLSEDNRNIETLRIPVDGEYEPQRISGVGEVLRVDLEANQEAIRTFLDK
ncbi:LCP family protein [Niallia sp. Krafla_26]|uniref:LCP family protein n=1 Tax=Niallia sp. Krafla_26 TaxID=3064703 RepID=UPI003D17269A